MIDRRLLYITAIIAVVTAGQVRAQGTPIPLSQMDHRAWVGEDAPPLRGSHSLGRSPDGYLWLSAVDGIIRFDGVRFTVFDSTTSPVFNSAIRGEYTPSPFGSDGAFRITRPDGGIMLYTSGRFVLERAGSPAIGRLIEIDKKGREWLYGGRTRIHIREKGRIALARLPAGTPESNIIGLSPDLGQGMWIGTSTRGLWHVSGDRAELMSKIDAKPRASARVLLHASDGTVWAIGTGLSASNGLHRLVNGRWLPVLLNGESVPPNARVAVEDSSHAVWIGTIGYGVLRWHNGVFEQYTKADGLSDVSVDDLMLGVAGSLWVATSSGGLDLLRPTEMVTLGASRGLPFPAPYRTVQDSLGVIWSSGIGTTLIAELHGGALEGRPGPISHRPIALPGAPRYEVLSGARDGGVWLAPFGGGLVRYRHDRVDRWTTANGIHGDRIRSAEETPDGAVWLSHFPYGLGVLRNGRYTPIVISGDSTPFVNRVVVTATNRVWAAGREESYIVELHGDSVLQKLGPADGIPGPISDLVLEGGDTLWASTPRALVRLIGSRITTVRAASLEMLVNPLTQLGVAGGFLWLTTDRRTGRIPLATLHAAADDSTAVVPAPRFFGAYDGLPVPRWVPFGLHPVMTTREGRLLISTPAGISVFDPSHRVPRHEPARPHVEEIAVGGRPIPDTGQIRVPPNPGRITIRYTVTDLLAGARTRIAYRLDPIDTAWIDGALPRVAIYTQLRPGQYRFRVRGLDVDDTSAPAEATLAFEVLPAWYQTLWSGALALLIIAATAAGVAVAIQRRRSHLATERLHLEFQGMLSERTRIARELHDTLLQGFTGIVLHLEALRRGLGNSPQAQEELSRILTIADSTLFDARQSVWDMRARVSDDKPLAEQLEEVSTTLGEGNSTAVHYTSNGEPIAINPDATGTVLHICREAVRNALQHANARTIDVVLRHEAGSLTLAVADDGRGMAEHLNSPPGHFGIIGMRERAARIGGVLTISSASNAGTRVELTIPTEGNR